MAKPGELAELISQQFGTELPTVRQQARSLRDADLMTKERGGRGAGSLSPRDAAHLLIAATGTRAVSKSVELVARPGGLTAGQAWEMGFLTVPELATLSADHSFADAVEALLMSVISGSMQKAAETLEGGPVDLVHDVSPAINIEVTILGPLPRASILIEELVTDEDGRRYRYKDHFQRLFYSARRSPPTSGSLASVDVARHGELDSDLRTEMTFTHRTLVTVGALLAR